MEKHIIEKLPDILKKNIDTLKNTSKDFSDSNNIEYMTNYEDDVINFDNVIEKYSEINQMKHKLTSNDALYIKDKNNFYFIEFKNGVMSTNKYQKNIADDNIINKLKNKIYDSLLVLSNIKYSNGNNFINEEIVEFAKNNIEYILVFNRKKSGRIFIHNHRQEKAGKKTNLFNLIKFKNFIFRDIHFCSKEEFEIKFKNEIK